MKHLCETQDLVQHKYFIVANYCSYYCHSNFSLIYLIEQNYNRPEVYSEVSDNLQLKTLPIYYLTVPVGHKSQQTQLDSPLHVLHGWYKHILEVLRKNLLSSFMLLAKILYLPHLGSILPFLCWLEATNIPSQMCPLHFQTISGVSSLSYASTL